MYAYLLFGYGTNPEEFNFRTLYGVMVGFSVPHLVMAGWIHYLVFDLFVGAWEVRDAMRRNVPHWLVVPCLVLTLMFGPIGLLAYVLVRFFRTGVLEFEESDRDGAPSQAKKRWLFSRDSIRGGSRSGDFSPTPTAMLRAWAKVTSSQPSCVAVTRT